MKEQQFKDISQTITCIGFYLMNLGNIELFNDTQMHRNIINLLTMITVELNANLEGKPCTKSLVLKEDKQMTYITKQQVIEMCHPFITQYGLNQAIHKNEIPYYKRGNKYFFVENEIVDWINHKKNNSDDNVRNSYSLV